jgi:ribosome-binding protein aMBF1 (putative translation factor)
MYSANNIDLQKLLILKSVLKAAREKKGLTAEELADIFCLKEWHIREIEEADTFFTFYSMAIKVKAVKRIGAYLGLKESDYLSLET